MYKEYINFINQKKKTIINLDKPDCHKTTLSLENRIRSKDKLYLSILDIIVYLLLFNIHCNFTKK